MIFKTNNLNILLTSLRGRSWAYGLLLVFLLALPLTSTAATKKVHEQNDRQYWCSLAYRMAQPVLEYGKGRTAEEYADRVQSKF